ncbi:MAG TPA: glycosyltransferase [Kiritimatiellia bacterium]|nr:glycosyltransferase [Kiritimatiellia bacterium]
MTMPEMSVIIPAEHRGKFLAKAIESAICMTSPAGGFEIIVGLLRGDTDARRTAEEVMGRAGVQVHLVEAGGRSHASILNAACRLARGRVLVFADDDCVFSPDWLVVLDEVWKTHPGAVMVGGSDRLPPGSSPFALALDVVLNSWVGSGMARRGEGWRAGTYYPKLWGMAILREKAMELARPSDNGPRVFDEDLEVMEAADLGSRCRSAGYQILYCKDWVIGHHRHTNWKLFALRCWQMAVAAKRLGTHGFAHGLLAIWNVGMLLAVFAAVLVGGFRPVVLSAFGLYAAILLTMGLVGAVKTGRASVAWRVPLLLMVVHFARGWGYLLGSRNGSGV